MVGALDFGLSSLGFKPGIPEGHKLEFLVESHWGK